MRYTTEYYVNIGKIYAIPLTINKILIRTVFFNYISGIIMVHFGTKHFYSFFNLRAQI